MSAYRARGGDVFSRLRVEHRLNLEELALLLLMVVHEQDINDVEDLALDEVRRLVTGQLAVGGRDALLAAADLRGQDDGPEHLTWCRRQIARAYARDYAQFPEELARFQNGES